MTDQSLIRTTARRALVCLDLTDLTENCDAAAIDELCRRAQTPHGFVAAVCIWPRFVAQAARALDRTGIKVATVVNFPSGEEPLDAVLAATEAALDAGADEIDAVVPYASVEAGEPQAVTDFVRAVKDICGTARLKAILETGALQDAGLIALAADRALEGGADFLKTSTGKVAVNAMPEAAEAMLKTIERRGSGAGFKASGGVRSVEDAGVYLGLADRIMGSGWAGPNHFRIGASGLLSAVLAALEGSEVSDDDIAY